MIEEHQPSICVAVASVSESLAVDERRELRIERGGSAGGVRVAAVLAVASVSVYVAVDEHRELQTESGCSDGGLLCVGDGGAPTQHV